MSEFTCTKHGKALSVVSGLQQGVRLPQFLALGHGFLLSWHRVKDFESYKRAHVCDIAKL